MAACRGGKSRSVRAGRCARNLARTCYVLLAALLFSAGCERVDLRPASSAARRELGERAGARLTPPCVQPSIRTIELGQSVQGTPLILAIFGHGPDRVLIFGGIHGSEPTSAVLARKLADYLRIHWELFNGRTVAILAEANPDGLAGQRRVNAHGVDLNRNFPAANWQLSRGRRRHGSAAASEPETRAIIQAVELIRPSRIISIHSTRRGTHCNNFDGPAEHLASLMSRFNGYPVKTTMGYPTPGSFGSWAGIDRAIPTITLELPSDLSGSECWRENADALVAFIQTSGQPFGE
jgi:protein MpaA